MSDTNIPRRGGFGGLIKNPSNRKLLIFISVVIVAAVAYAFLGGKGKDGPASNLQAPPTLPNVQGSARVSPSYGAAIAKSDQDNQKDAIATGKSFTPTLVLPPESGVLPSSLDPDDGQGPPIRPNAPPDQPPVPRFVPAPSSAPVYRSESAPVAAVMPVDQGLEEAMEHQMALLGPTNPAEAKTYLFANADATGGAVSHNPANAYAPGAGGTGSGTAGGTMGVPQDGGSAVPQSRFKVPAAGTILYSRLVGRVNSDTPGPVIGEILQGPFAGSRLLGTFQFSENGVVINFSSMTVPYKDDDGNAQSEVVPINSVAVDASHLGTAMATDINRHLLARIGTAFGTAFLQGIGQAVATSGSTVSSGLTGTTVSNSSLNTGDQLLVGAGAAAGAAGQVFSQIYGNERTTITVEDGTPFGLLFLGTGN
jgi:intracellular multiplication protein IcmE